MNEFLTNPQNLFYILSVFGLIIIVLILIVIRLSIKTKKLMSGKNGRSLEQSFMSMQKEIFELQNSRKSIEDYLKKVEKRLGTSIRGFENVTFDAFSGMASGGKSFSTAFLISSLLALGSTLNTTWLVSSALAALFSETCGPSSTL